MKQPRLYPTYFESLAIPGAARLSTWIVAGVSATAAALIAFTLMRESSLIGTFTLLGACIGIVPVTMRAIYAMLLAWIQQVPNFLRDNGLPPSEMPQWFDLEFDRFTSSRAVSGFGIIYSVFAASAFWIGGAFEKLPLFIAVFFLLVTAIASFVCGVGLAAIAYLARFIWQLGRRYSVRISDHGYGVLSTGRLLVKCYLLVAFVWCFYTGSATWGLRGRWVPLLALAAPAVVFFVGSFIACQFPLHRRMVESKCCALVELDDLLERLTPRQPSDMTEERRKQLEFCVAEIKRVRSLPEWPFSVGNLSGVMGASVAAIAPQILQAALTLIIKKPS